MCDIAAGFSYKETLTTGWTCTSGVPDVPVCSSPGPWTGVTCTSSVVTIISIYNMGVVGTISPSVGMQSLHESLYTSSTWMLNYLKCTPLTTTLSLSPPVLSYSYIFSSLISADTIVSLLTQAHWEVSIICAILYYLVLYDVCWYCCWLFLTHQCWCHLLLTYTGSLTSLANLHLDFNSLTGSIPSSLGNMHTDWLLQLSLCTHRLSVISIVYRN